MDKLYVYLLSSVLLVGVGAAVLQCSGAVCGNGAKEGDEQCDNGPLNGMPGSNCGADCKLVSIPRASVQVSFDLLQMEAPGFNGSTCKDLGAVNWSLHLDGPSPDDKMLPCLTNSQRYDSVTVGTYQATITLLDATGNPLTKPVKTMMAAATLGQTANLTVDFHQMDFLKQDYTGSLLFTPNWGAAGAGCNAAVPAVTMEGLKLTKPGSATPIAGMTVDGLKLDGTFGGCFMPSVSTSFQQIAALPWGHYDLYLYGKIVGGFTAYCQKFDVFAAPGTATSIYQLMVDPASTDGGACP